MSPDSIPTGDQTPYTPIDQEEYGDATPLPPYLEDSLTGAEMAVGAALDEHEQIIVSAIDSVDAALRAAEIEHNGALSEVIGATDAALRKGETEHIRALTKLYDDTWRTVVYAQEDVRASGTSVPPTVEAARIELDDPTGEMILARLVGEPMVELVPPPPPPPPTPPPDDAAPPPADDFLPIGMRPPGVLYPGGVVPTDPSSPPVSPPPPPPPSGEVVGCMTWDYVSESGEPHRVQTPVYAGQPSGAPPTIPGYAYVGGGYSAGPCSAPSPPTSPPSPPPPPSECGCTAPPPTAPPVVVTCPVPPPPPPPPATPPATGEPPSVGTEGFGLIWSSTNVCALLDKQFSDRPVDTLPSILRRTEPQETAETWLGRAITYGIDAMRSVADVANEATLRASFIGEGAAWAMGHGMIMPLWEALDPKAVPDKEAASRMAIKIGMARWAERQTGVPMDYIAQTEQYLLQYTAPQYIPDQSGLDLAYLRDEISGDQWACLTRANGNVVGCAEWVLNAKQTRPDVHQVVQLYLRGDIKTREGLHERLRELGVLDKLYEDNLIKLAEWVPGPPDIVTFMVRDVEDPRAVREGDLDKDFEEKFYGPGGAANPGPLAKWARAHGLTEEVFRRYWRAHWRLPSPTQLYEMLHRLRPDRPERKAWERAFNNATVEEQAELLKVEPPIVTEEMCRRALELNDIAPAWIDRLMAVSYNPMTRTDALNAFHANVMTAEELRERLRDTGLDLPTATRTVELQEAIRARRNANISGVWTVREIAREYGDGVLTSMAADQLLAPLIPDPGQRQRLLAGVDQRSEARARRERLRTYQRTFFVGIDQPADALAKLQGMGIAPQRAQDMVDEWDWRRRGRLREVSARMVSDGLANGIITPDQAYTRLANLGYIAVDAEFIVAAALKRQFKAAERDVKAARAEYKALVRDERAARRANDQMLSERAQELERMIREAERERDRIMREVEARPARA